MVKYILSVFLFSIIFTTMSANNKPYKKHNIFNEQDYAIILQRIATINDTSARQWGTMNVAEMLVHCNLQLKLALQEIIGTKHEGSFMLRTSFGKWMGLYGPNWKKGATTPTQMNIKKQNLPIGKVEAEKEILLNYLKTVMTKDAFQEHPIFGKLNKKDWGRLIWKHLDHHLRQLNA
jgi:Protein of unknown function (DUF1569)